MTVSLPRRHRACCAMLAILAAAGVAQAQEVTGQPDASKVVTEGKQGNGDQMGGDEKRVADGYEPKGVELGSFLLLPEATVGESYNANIYATRDGDKADEITTVGSSFHLQSRFDENALNVDGNLQQEFFADHASENQLNGRIIATGRYDVSHDSELDARAGFIGAHEDRTSPDAVNGTVPTPYDQTDLMIGAKTAPGPWNLSAQVTRQRYTYEEVPSAGGGVIDNQGRNRSEYDALVRIAYELSPGYYAVGEGQWNERDYDRQIDISDEDRSSRGYTADAGIGLDISQVIRGDFLLGYFQQDYPAPLVSPSGLHVKAVFNWTPYKTTLVAPSLERTVQESTVAGSSGIDETNLILLVRHEFERNIVLSGFASAARDSFTGLNSVAWMYQIQGTVTYAFSRNLFATGELGYKERNAPEGTGNGYSQLVTTLRIGIRL